MDKRFKKGCVLIVGGSGGIGSLCAQEFAQSGARVAITYFKNEQAAIDVADNIKNNVKIYQLDNSDPKSVGETFQKVQHVIGDLVYGVYLQFLSWVYLNLVQFYFETM